MNWQLSTLSVVVLIASVLSLTIAVILWRRRPAHGAVYLAALMLSVAVWQFGYALELITENFEGKFFWLRVQYIGIVFASVMWFAFALVYTGKQRWLSRRNYSLILVEPIVTLILVWTNNYHGWVWRSLTLDTAMGRDFLIENMGFWAYIHTIYFYLMMLAGSIMLIQTLSRGWNYYRGQTLALMVGVLIPWFANIADIMGINPLSPVELTPIALTLSGLAIAWGIYRYRLLDIVPVAREAIIENITDGVIVLDNQNRVVDLNRSAESIFNYRASDAIGRKVVYIWPDWPSEVTLPYNRLYTGKEVEINKGEDRGIYDMRLSALFDRRGSVTGRLVVLREITTQKKAENMLRRRDEILEAISFTAELFLREKSWQRVVPDVLARVGKTTGVQFAYLMELNSPEASYRWSSDPDIKANTQAGLPAILYEIGSDRDWLETLNNGQVIHGPIHDLPEMGRDELSAFGARSIIVLPIFVDENLWGLIGLVNILANHYWSPIEIDALRVFASTVGAAVQREHYEELLQNRALIISTLLNVSEIIGSTLDAVQVMDRIVLAAHNLIPAERVAVFLWDEESSYLSPVMPGEESKAKLVLPDELRQEFSSLRLRPDDIPLLKELMERNLAIAIDDTDASHLVPEEIKNLYGVRSLLAVPFILQEKFIGALYIDHTSQSHTYSMEEIDIANALARQAALALERARLYTQSQDDAEELASLYRASTSLLEVGGDIESLASQIAQAVTREFDSAYCSVLMINEDKDELVMIAQAGIMELKDVPLPLQGKGITVAAARQGRAIYAADVRQDSRYVPASEYTRSELAFPLRYGEKVIGVLNLESPDLDAFDERDQRIVAAFAENAALALENIRLFNATRLHARQMKLLNDITRIAIEISDFQHVLNTMADRISELIDADHTYITLWDQELGRTIPGTASQNVREAYESITPESGEVTVTESVLRENRLLVIEDVTNSEYVSPRIATHFTTKSLIALPLIANNQKYGAMMIAFNQTHKFTSRETGLCEQAAQQVALALSKAWSLEIARSRAEEAENLRKATVALSSSLDLQQVLVRILIHLENVVNFDSACIFLLEGKGLHAVAGRGFPDQSDVIGREYPIDLLYRENQYVNTPVILEDAQKDSRFQGWGGTSYVRGWMGVPLKAGGKTIGYLTLDSRKVSAFDNYSANLAQAFANQAAIAIENSRLFESAKQRAREAETLRQAGEIVAAALDQDKAIQLILEQLERVVPYDSASVQLLRDGYLEIVGGLGWPDELDVVGMHFPVPGDNPNTHVIQQKQPYILNDARMKFAPFTDKPHDHIYSWMGIPLIVHERVIGMLAVDSAQEDYFTRDHARLASAFADQVAIVIENARLYSEEQHRVMQLDALRATAADISAELELPRLLETILKRAVSLLAARGGELGLFDEEHQELVIVASHNMGNDYSGTRLKMGEGVMGAVAEALEPMVVENYFAWEDRSPQYVDGHWGSVMASPLMVHGRLVGVIGIVDEDPERIFSEIDLELLNMFAYQSAIAVDNAHLYREAKEAAERRAVLHNVSQEIVAASMEPEQIYAAIHKAAGQLMPAEALAITLLDKDHGDINAVYLVDKEGRAPPMRIPQDHGLSGHVLSTGKSVYIEDYDQTDELARNHFGSDVHTRSLLAVPLRLGEEVIGMLSTQSYQPNAYNEEDMVLLEMLAAHAAIALENARLFGQVQLLAITDHLTDLYNRRGLMELGRREIDRSRRFGRLLTAIMLDIDNFKLVNDAHGHAVGDQVLVVLAEHCRDVVREVDLVVRYGGEEFLILLPEADLESAVKVAERLRERIERTPIKTDVGDINITISLGVAPLREDIEDLNALIKSADMSMYAAKQAGRNRVVVDRLLIAE